MSDLRIAVLTFTRDRLAYTAHCFATLERNAGCEYDHFVLDQRSADRTWEWLQNWAGQNRDRRHIYRGLTNIGICAGANMLLDQANPADYDVIVRYDNDCEVLDPGTLLACAELAADYGAIVAPKVLGLQNPPPTIRTVSLGGTLVDETAILGGIFMAIPAGLFTDNAFSDGGFRYDESFPLWAGDEAIVPWHRAGGGVCGYVQGLAVNHYETTAGQRERYPAYFERKDAEEAAA